ncbi:MAG: hypothetical protein QM690_15835 [Sphingobium sp.]
MIAVPPGLLDLIFSSVGLSELVPALAPPVGWPVRIVLALLAAAMAAGLAGGTGRESGPVGDGRAGRKRTADMGWTQSLGLHHLVRLARGETGIPDRRVTITPAMRAPRFRRGPQEKVQETLARHRADLHPDAPPRAPLMASRDLPPVTELTIVETPAGDVRAAQPLPRIATPIRDTTDTVRPRPLPRAPEPLSDSDLGWVRGLLNGREGASEDFLAGPVSTEPLSEILPEAPAADIAADDSLLSLLGRFEQGVAHRIALRDAADAQSRIEESMADPAVPPVEEPVREMEMDEALTAALETLRKLSSKANGR